MNKKIYFLLFLGLIMICAVIYYINLNYKLVPNKSAVQEVVQDVGIQSKVKSIETDKTVPTISKKTYTDSLFSIQYPAFLKASSDIYFSDAPEGSNELYVSFFNNQFKTDNSNHEVNRIDRYLGLDVNKLTKQEVINPNAVIINGNKFIRGNDPLVAENVVYWVQAKNYALKFTFHAPIENPNYNGFIDLESLKLN